MILFQGLYGTFALYVSGMLNDVGQDEVHHRHTPYILHNRQ